MPRGGSLTFADIEGKLEYLVIECSKCPRRGRYSVAKLIAEHGRDAMMTYWSESITKDCPRAIAGKYDDWCGANCPDLPRVV